MQRFPAPVDLGGIFRCNNSTYRPVINIVELLGRYKDCAGRAKYYDPTE